MLADSLSFSLDVRFGVPTPGSSQEVKLSQEMTEGQVTGTADLMAEGQVTWTADLMAEQVTE